MAIVDVGVKKLEQSEAKVAAPPKMFVSVLNGVRVVSSATDPKTVNNFLMLFFRLNKC